MSTSLKTYRSAMHEIDIEKLPEFDNHKLVSFVFDEATGLRGYIAIHRASENTPSLGATRLWQYETETEAARDALRLSRLMSYKAALAGLPYGGAKAALIDSPKLERHRKAAFKMYAEKISYLGGQFVTGTDVGVMDKDVKLMRKTTPYVIGTKVDPAYYTAVSVVNAIEIAVGRALGHPELENRSLAIQGLGKTGYNILKILYRSSNTFYVADIDPMKVKVIKKKFPKVNVIKPQEIHKQRVDIFVPCALSGVLNAKTVAQMRVKVIAGSANNQLAGDHIGELLHKLNILYAPDYAANAGGLIAVADEMESRMPSKKRILERTDQVRATLQEVFEKSEKKNLPTNFVANAIAESRFNNHL